MATSCLLGQSFLWFRACPLFSQVDTHLFYFIISATHYTLFRSLLPTPFLCSLPWTVDSGHVSSPCHTPLFSPGHTPSPHHATLLCSHLATLLLLTMPHHLISPGHTPSPHHATLLFSHLATLLLLTMPHSSVLTWPHSFSSPCHTPLFSPGHTPSPHHATPPHLTWPHSFS